MEPGHLKKVVLVCLVNFWWRGYESRLNPKKGASERQDFNIKLVSTAILKIVRVGSWFETAEVDE